MKRRVYTVFFAVFVFLGTGLSADEPDLLEYDDIHGIMDQMLEQHVEVRRVSPVVIQRSLKIYIDQTDPGHVYLLKSEASPFLEPTPSQLSRFVVDYNAGNYQVFQNLNALTQRGIMRARRLRGDLYENWEQLFDLAERGESALPPSPRGKDLSFVKDEAELRARLRDDIVRFIIGQQTRFGRDALIGNEERVLALYERQLVSEEDQYLFVKDGGVNMSADYEEHYQTLHILKAMAKSLDSHSAFFNASEAYDMRVRLEKGFQGIGVVLQESFNGVIVTRLIKGGPAERSGQIQVDDRLVEVDGESVVDQPFDRVLDLIRGLGGTSVHLKLERDKGEGAARDTEVVDVMVKRERIVVDESRVDVSWEPVDGGIVGKITLYSFYEGDGGVNSESDVRQALQELHQHGRLRGLVLDLRQNTGGFLMQAVKVAGLFISNGVVVSSVYSDGRERVFRDLDGHTYYNGPLVVLTSRLSASAAEIVAQTLQDYGAAIVVGDDHTYGKGSIQHQNVTDENSASFYKVTVGRYYTVSGRTPQIQGVRADIIVPGLLSDEEIGEAYTDYPLSYNTVDPSFDDDLDDVDGDVRYWYSKYYLPSLQRPTDRWTALLPELRERSRNRLARSQAYQQFLQEIRSTPMELSRMKDEIDEGPDLQMEEAVDIVKDILDLRGRAVTSN